MDTNQLLGFLKIDDVAVREQAKEYHRKTGSGGHSFASKPCRTAVCVELALRMHNHDYDRDLLIKKSCDSKVNYEKVFPALKNLLKLEFPLSMEDLLDKVSASAHIRSAAKQLLKEYQERSPDWEREPAAVMAAVLCVASKKHKDKLDKDGLASIAGISEDRLSQLVEQVNAVCVDVKAPSKKAQKEEIEKTKAQMEEKIKQQMAKIVQQNEAETQARVTAAKSEKSREQTTLPPASTTTAKKGGKKRKAEKEEEEEEKREELMPPPPARIPSSSAPRILLEDVDFAAIMKKKKMGEEENYQRWVKGVLRRCAEAKKGSSRDD